MPGRTLQADMSRLMHSYTASEPRQTLLLARRLARRYPDQPLPLNILGAVQAKLGEHKSAIRSYRKALDIEPRYPDALGNLCQSLKQLGRLDEAIASYRKLQVLRPNDPEPYFDLANLLTETGEFAAAVAQYQRSIELNPASTTAHFHLGNALDMIGKTNEAQASFRNALEVDAEYIDAYLRIGHILHDQQKYDMAISWFENAIAIEPEASQAHYRLARSLQLAGRHDEAIAGYRRCLELDPLHHEAGHFLAATQQKTTAHAPRTYVTDLFDNFAPSFEQQLAGKLGYSGPDTLKDMVEASRNNDALFARTLDLGCGTGLAGVAFRGMSSELVGVDLSTKMLDQARRKDLYDRLLHGEIAETLAGLNETFDLFICADTLVYIGDLEQVFPIIGSHSQPGTLFALSTEHNDVDSFTLLPSGRYAHSREYIEACALQSGFTLRDFKTENLRQEHRQWLTGGFYLLEYSGTV